MHNDSSFEDRRAGRPDTAHLATLLDAIEVTYLHDMRQIWCEIDRPGTVDIHAVHAMTIDRQDIASCHEVNFCHTLMRIQTVHQALPGRRGC